MKTGGAGMINEEAIKEITKMAFQIFVESKVMANQNTKDKHEALVLAVNALEKQIPKKPLEIKKTGTSVSINASSTISSVVHNYEGLCSNCKTQNTNRRIGTRVSYCENCGQALDWGDIDD